MTATAPDEHPGWLEAREREVWLRLAGVMTRLPAALDSQLQRDAGLSHFDYMVMALLSESPDRTLRMSELASMASSSLSRLSHVARKLEKQGWLRRQPCPEDGRYTNAILTESGHDKVVASAPGHVRQVRALVFDALDDTRLSQLADIGERLLGQLDSAPRTARSSRDT